MPHGPRFEKLVSEAKNRIQELTASEAAQRQAAGALLVDVRETDEFRKLHAAKAVHLSKGVIELKIEQLAPNPQSTIICYCGGGSRSALAVESLEQMGYERVFSVAGGFKAWQEAELPVES